MTSGILLIDKAAKTPSFRLVSILRRLTKIEKIGHAGTLDPFATGLMVMLIGREYTKRSNEFLNCGKRYRATIHLGIGTDSFDIDGQVIENCDRVPTLAEVEEAIASFRGTILQTPPMFSAKKIQGKKLYELARKGITVERAPVPVQLYIELLSYNYPYIEIDVQCSKGTYIRSLGYDIAKFLATCGHLSSLTRLNSGPFSLDNAIPESALQPGCILTPLILHPNEVIHA